MATATLRRLRASDADMVLKWRNNPEVAKHMYATQLISAAEHQAWMDRILHSLTDYAFVVELAGAPLGLASVTGVRLGSASWAFYLAEPEARGAGLGSWIEVNILRFAFEQLELGRLGCQVLLSNPDVWKMHEGFGFQREGILRHYVTRQDGPQDVVQLSMLKAEYLAVRATLVVRGTKRGYPLLPLPF